MTGPVPQGLLVVAKQSDMADREGKILYDIPYMWNLKRNDKNMNLQSRKRLTDLENELMVASWKR